MPEKYGTRTEPSHKTLASLRSTSFGSSLAWCSAALEAQSMHVLLQRTMVHVPSQRALPLSTIMVLSSPKAVLENRTKDLVRRRHLALIEPPRWADVRVYCRHLRKRRDHIQCSALLRGLSAGTHLPTHNQSDARSMSANQWSGGIAI